MKKITLFLLCSLFVLVSCGKNLKKCKVSPDYEKMSESILENKGNLEKSELKSAQMRCQW